MKNESQNPGFRLLTQSAMFGGLGLLLGLAPAFTQAQTQPASLSLTAKLRDFVSQRNGGGTFVSIGDPAYTALEHPHFNPQFGTATCNAGAIRLGMPQGNISTAGSTDANFEEDQRNPVLNPGHPTNACIAQDTRFSDWYNDVNNVNRKFKLDLTLTRVAQDKYVYTNNSFFPLDPGGPYTKFSAADPNPYADIFAGAGGNHNFGFTLELHTQFTYQSGQAQIFHFRGDDDVWVFVNGKLALDLGGIHGAIDGEFNLDNIAASFGLVNNQAYPLDFYFAERHTTESNLEITTFLLVQDPQPVAPPTATPYAVNGYHFSSQVGVTLTHPIKGDSLKIYYTLDGSDPTTSPTRTLYAGTPIDILQSDTLKAVAIHDNTKLYVPSSVLTSIYIKDFVASTLEILNANGLPFPNGYITQASTGYTLRLTTTQAGLASVRLFAKTVTGLDADSVTLSTVQNLGDRYVYTGVIPFSVAAAILDDGKTQSSLYDSLVVSWANPKDAADHPQTKLRVRAAPVQAQIFFATDSTGATPTTQYTATAPEVFIFVRDEELPPGMTAKVALTVTHLAGGATDIDTVTLAYLGNGLYRAKIATDLNKPSARGDGKLQISSGDQIQGDFTDPQDGDKAQTNAGFGTPASIRGQLAFVDKNGVLIVPGTVYSPSEGKVFLRLTDDFAGGTIDSIPAALSIVNKNGAAAPDSETIILVRIDSTMVGDRVYYEGSLALKDTLHPTRLNDIVETYWKGNVTATTMAHQANGSDEGAVTATLVVAYPNQVPIITVTDGKEDSAVIDRKTPQIVIKLDEQSISSGTDTLTVDVTCLATNDILRDVILIEVSPGKYVSAEIPKNESTPDAGDGALSCKSDDAISITYQDPVYPADKAQKVIPLSDPTPGTLYFTKVGSDAKITAVIEQVDSTFVVTVEGKTPSVEKIDTLPITISLPGGDAEVFQAVETDKSSGIFKVTVPFQFVVGAGTKNNQVLEGVITPTSSDNRVVATVSGKTENNDVSGQITLVAGFIPPQSAYIADANKNGRGDRVVISFTKPLPRLPDSVGVYWNDKDVTKVTVLKNKLSFLDGSNNSIIIADLLDREYPDTLSGAGNGPYAKMPSEGLFGGSTVAIADSIPPTILKAVKRPADILNAEEGDPGFNIDTLIITLSEPIKEGSVSKQMLKFDLECGSYNKATLLPAVELPTLSDDGKTLILLVDNSVISPPVNSCLYLNADPGNEVVDLADIQGIGKVKLAGENGSRLLSGLRGYPPVSNLDPNSPNWQVAINDAREGKTGYATPQSGSDSWEILWVPPVDLANILRGDPYIPEDGPGSQGTSEKEAVQAQKVPGTQGYSTTTAGGGNLTVDVPISLVQVVTTTKYIVDIAIFDHTGQFVRHLRQSFGYRGELANRERVVPGGYASYLVWDLKEKNKGKVGQGVYIWKMTFNFEGKRQQVKYVRTGVLRQE